MRGQGKTNTIFYYPCGMDDVVLASAVVPVMGRRTQERGTSLPPKHRNRERLLCPYLCNACQIEDGSVQATFLKSSPEDPQPRPRSRDVLLLVIEP